MRTNPKLKEENPHFNIKLVSRGRKLISKPDIRTYVRGTYTYVFMYIHTNKEMVVKGVNCTAMVLGAFQKNI